MQMNPKIIIAVFTVLIVGLLGYATFRFVQNQKPRTSAQKTTPVSLLDHTTDNSSVSVSILGPVTANENYTVTTITVSQTIRTIQVQRTYDNTIGTSKDFTNNPAAYEEFMRALAIAGFTKTNPKYTNTDERGYCAAGQRYLYKLGVDDRNLMRLWGSSCGTGTFAGSGSTVRQLFQRQIPDYAKVVKSLDSAPATL